MTVYNLVLLQAVYSSQLAQYPHYVLQVLVEVSGLVGVLFQIQCFKFYKYLGLTYSLPPTLKLTAALC